MFRFFRSARRSQPKNQRSSVRLGFDRLEARDTPSINSSTFHVNTATALDQFDSVNASSTNGSSVVVWTHQYSTSDFDIRAQRYNSSGAKVGGEIIVANSSRKETNPAVCMDKDGWFYVAYEDQTTSTNFDVKVVRYNASGVKQGSTITVAGATKKEYDPSISCDSNGNFVVSYTNDFSSTDQDIKASRYTFGGTLLGTISVATSTTYDERHSYVVRSNASLNSDFGIVYERSYDIYFSRYTSTGVLRGTTAISTNTLRDELPSAGVDDAGNYVIVWQRLFGSTDWDVKARKISKWGFLGSEININSSSSEISTNAVVAYERVGGDFVVAYKARPSTSFSYKTVVMEMNSIGTVRSTFTLHTGQSSNISDPSLSIDKNDNYMLTFTLFNGTGDAARGIFGRFGKLI